MGERVSCALDARGAVFCWGSNEDGRAGLGERDQVLAPTRVEGLPAAHAIAVGDTHACALDREGHVWCWGKNEHGELGDGTTTSRRTPVRVAGLEAVVELDASRFATCARSVREGTSAVRCWGRAGFVGVVSRADVLTPTAVEARDVHEVVLGAWNGCFLNERGDARCWGFASSGLFGPVPGPFATPRPALRWLREHHVPIRGIALGERHACVRLDHDVLACTGENEGGELVRQWAGDDATCEADGAELVCTWREPPPVREEAPDRCGCIDEREPPPERPLRTERAPLRAWLADAHSLATAVAADGLFGAGRTCLITEHEDVACFGQRHPSDWAHRRPTPFPLTRGALALDVASHHGCAVRRDGHAVCWGSNRMGELGDGTTDASEPDAVLVVDPPTAR